MSEITSNHDSSQLNHFNQTTLGAVHSLWPGEDSGFIRSLQHNNVAVLNSEFPLVQSSKVGRLQSSEQADDPLRLNRSLSISGNEHHHSSSLGSETVGDIAANRIDPLLNSDKLHKKKSNGNALKTAQQIKLTNQWNTIEDSVGSSDRLDFYRFKLDTGSSFHLALAGEQNNVDVVLLNASGKVVKDLSGPFSKKRAALHRALNAGTYYLKVTGHDDDTSYRLSLSGDPGGARRSAQPMSANQQAIVNTVGSTDRSDMYRFVVDKKSTVECNLKGLKGNADLALINSQGQVIQTSRHFGKKDESIAATLEQGNYYVKVTGWGKETKYRLKMSAQEVPVLPIPKPSAPGTGVFTVGETGKVSIDYLFDGSALQGELAIFNLKGMEQYGIGSKRYMQEAMLRALGNSADSGYVAILDQTEGAKFNSTAGEPNFNAGEYRGTKTFTMNPGDQFGIMLVPNGTTPDALFNSDLTGDQRPLFSLPEANLESAVQMSKIVETHPSNLQVVDGDTFGFEDTDPNNNSDWNYGDLIFQVQGATTEVSSLDKVINPAKDWRSSELGKKLVNYADVSNKGLTGWYYDNNDFTAYRGRRTDGSVNFDWGTGSPSVMTSPDSFSIRWTGQVEPQYSETYAFYTQSDEKVRLWVNGQLLIDNWTNHSAIEDSGKITLQSGQKYDIKLEYAEEAGDASVKLLWSSPSQLKEIIPQNFLSPDSNALPLDPRNGLEYRPNEVHVKFQAGATEEQIQALTQMYSATSVERLVPFNPDFPSQLDQWRILHFAPQANIPQIRDLISQSADIQLANLDYTIEFDAVPNDSSFTSGDLWGLNKIGAPAAWAKIKPGSPDVIVGVLDTGVDYTHPDLAANMVLGYDFGQNDNDPMDDAAEYIEVNGEPKRSRGHGTHVAGIIGAVANNHPTDTNGQPLLDKYGNPFNVVGVAQNVKIMPLKVVGNNGQGHSANAARAIYFAVANGAKILNASFGGPRPNAFAQFFGYDGNFGEMSDAIDFAAGSQVLFVTSAGNDGVDIDKDDNRRLPAGFSLAPNVITVANTDQLDYLTFNSNYGKSYVSLAAPGEGILSTIPFSITPDGYSSPPGYDYNSGTSMSAPYVAGAAALLLSQNPFLKANELKDILMNTGDLVKPPQQGTTVSGKRLNINNAIDSLYPTRRIKLTVHLVKTLAHDDASFYPEGSINGVSVGRLAYTDHPNDKEYGPRETDKDGDSDNQATSPSWTFIQDVTGSTVDINFQLYDEDHLFNPTDYDDINPLPGIRDLSLTYNLFTNQVTDKNTGNVYVPDANGQIHSIGEGDDDRAEIWFSIDDSVV